jgi:hypothetical protein
LRAGDAVDEDGVGDLVGDLVRAAVAHDRAGR